MAHRRNRGHSPSDSHQPSLIVNLDTNNNNNGGSPNRKVHGRRAAVIVAGVGAGANKKHVYVIIGSLCVVALCLVGMWASDSTMDVGSRGPRQIDQRMASGSSSSDRRSSTATATRRKKKKGNHKNLPKGIGQRDRKDYFRNPQQGGVEVLKLPPIGGIRQKDILVDGSTDNVSRNSNEDADAAPRLTIQNPLEDEPWIQKEKEDGSEEQEQEESESAAKQSKKKSASPDEEETVKSKEEEDSNDNNRGRHSKKSEDEEEEDDSKEEGTDVANENKGGEDEESASEDNNAPSTSTSQPRVVSLHFEALSNDDSNNRNKRRHSRSHHNEHNHDTRADVAGPNKYKNVLLTKVGRMPVYNSKDKRPVEDDEDEESDRFINPYPDDDQYFDRVEKVKQSKKYRRNEREPLEDKECKPRHEWQTGAFPNCNILHEFELGQLSGMFGRALRKKLRKAEGEGEELVKYLAHGYWRDVWLVSKSSTTFDAESTEQQQQQQHIGESEYDEEITVLKTLRYKHDFTDRNYDRHRKDALASERLSNSPNVVDIFAYCSNSAVFEYGPGGDIEGKLWPYDDEEDKYYVADIPGLEKLDMAYQVARGIADMHDVEDDGYASIAHTDITPSQFIYINGRWKMNDFNRCRFMRVYKDDKKPCGFHVGANPGKFRAPEEYNYEEENEMIDVYSMGNIFYAIIAGEMPFEGQKESKAQKKVMDGTRPTIPDEVLESKDIAIKTLVSATRKCWEQKPEDRPSAASVRDEFKRVLDRIRKNNATKDS